MASKYKKRADGRYCTHVVIGVKSDGKPLRKTIYAHTIRELEEKAAELRRQVSTGTVIKDENVTVAEWAQEWLSTYKSGVSYNTKEMYKVTIHKHIIPVLGHLKLKEVRPHHVQRLINDKYSEGLTRRVEMIALTMRQVFKRAIENNLLVKNPAEALEVPKIDKPKKRTLTDDEKRYVELAELDLKSRAFVYILLYAGLRKGEALALMKKDINLKDKTITVYKNLITKGNRPEIKMSPKTEAGNRVIPIPSMLLDALAEYLPTLETLYVFPSANNELMSHIAFRRFWEKIQRQLNKAMGGNSSFMVLASDVTPHIFRHTYATMLFYAGVNMKTAQYLLGHSSINVTMEIYTHLDKAKAMNAADKINTLLSSSQSVVNVMDQ